MTFNEAIYHLSVKYRLTPRETEIFALVAEGKSNPEIGQALEISNKTVGNHVHTVLFKAGVNGRGELLSKVIFYLLGKSNGTTD